MLFSALIKVVDVSLVKMRLSVEAAQLVAGFDKLVVSLIG
jgi:hypothetical protein